MAPKGFWSKNHLVFISSFADCREKVTGENFWDKHLVNNKRRQRKEQFMFVVKKSKKLTFERFSS